MPWTPPKSGRMRFYLWFSEPLIVCLTFIDASRQYFNKSFIWRKKFIFHIEFYDSSEGRLTEFLCDNNERKHIETSEWTNEWIMTAESPVKVIDEETTKKRFKKTNFYCLRCGAPEIIKKDNIKYFAERQNFHPWGKSASVKDVETTFFVTALLYCVRCK